MTRDKILIIGASSFLGTKLRSVLKEKFKVIGTCLNNQEKKLYYLDITDKGAVNNFICKHNPHVVIHTAALSRIQKCERNKALAKKINYEGTLNVVNACKKTNCKLIFISTSYVFDGRKKNYTENDEPNPLNFYGKTKVMAEREVLMLKNSIIVRFDLLYGYNGPTQNNGLLAKIIKGEKFTGRDQKKYPLLVDDAAHAIQILIEKNVSGIYHLSGSESVTLFKLIRTLEKIAGKEVTFIADQGSNMVKRPKGVFLDTSKAQNLGLNFHSMSKSIQIIEKQYRKQTE